MTRERRSSSPAARSMSPSASRSCRMRPSVGCSTPMRSASSVWFTLSPNTLIQYKRAPARLALSGPTQLDVHEIAPATGDESRGPARTGSSSRPARQPLRTPGGAGRARRSRDIRHPHQLGIVGDLSQTACSSASPLAGCERRAGAVAGRRPFFGLPHAGPGVSHVGLALRRTAPSAGRQVRGSRSTVARLVPTSSLQEQPDWLPCARVISS